MKDYSTYSAENFANDDDFLKWVKYSERHPCLDKFWQDWLKENPQKKEEVEEARMMIFALLQEKQFSPEEGKQQEVWNRIDKIIDNASAQVKQVPLWQPWYSRAAVILILITTGLFLWYSRENQSTVLERNTEPVSLAEERINNSDQPNTIILSDGTSIVLQPHSVLQYPKTFDKDFREVYLTGEAFFEVTKDPSRPFLVHTHEIVTRVLGTSFTVRGYSNEKNVLVQVKTGKVSVFQENNTPKRKQSLPNETVEGVVLMPNQQVLFEREEMKMTKSLVEEPSVLIPVAKQDFQFIDTPIAEVFESIERVYGVDIVFDEDVLANCYLNASLSDVPLYDKLKLICKGIDTTYEIMDSHIIIYGKGCD